jgi:hypothetical protein
MGLSIFATMTEHMCTAAKQDANILVKGPTLQSVRSRELMHVQSNLTLSSHRISGLTSRT